MLPVRLRISSRQRPELRIRTNGRSSAKPRPAPSREVLAPGQPCSHEFTAIPNTSPGTVSQLGMRRLRQSVHPPAMASRVGKISAPSLAMAIRYGRDCWGRGAGLFIKCPNGRPCASSRKQLYGRIVTQGWSQVNVTGASGFWRVIKQTRTRTSGFTIHRLGLHERRRSRLH